MMNKMPIIYRVGRFLLSPLFKLYYNPKIYGKENLQIPGSKIIVSNHYHLYDQFNTIISTKEFIKYLAKKEASSALSNTGIFSASYPIISELKNPLRNYIISFIFFILKSSPKVTSNVLFPFS